MIAFKEYINLSFQYIIAERVKNSLFFYFGTPKDFLKFFNFSPDFLDGLDDTTGTSFFIAEQEKMTVIVVEQNLNLVRLLANQVCFIENGLITRSLSVDEINKDPVIIRRYLSV